MSAEPYVFVDPRDGNAEEEEELEQIRRYEDFTTIDWIQDSILERNRRLRSERNISSVMRGPGGAVTLPWLWAQIRKIASAGQSWFVVSLVGTMIGVNAALISIITVWLSDLKMGYCSDGWWLSRQFCCWEIDGEGDIPCVAWKPWSSLYLGSWIIYVAFAFLFSFTSAHLVNSFAKYAAGSGISEIKCILAGFVMHGYLGLSTFVIKSLTLPLVIASGLSVGKEGPSVHVACAIGNVIARLFPRFSRSEGKMREILTAASAAGVAVAFGSPIGGVLFSIEEMSHFFSIKTMWRSFFCALMATVSLSAMNPFRTGKLVLFQVTYDRDWHFFEIVFFIIIGIFGGLYGAFVIKFNIQVAAFRRKHLSSFPVTEAVTLATLTAIFGYFNRFLRIDMTESMEVLFRECEGGGDYAGLCQSKSQWIMVNSLFLATIFRIGFVVVSYGCKVPAGIFVPSMAIGATFGRMLGIIVKAVHQAYPKASWFATCQPDVPCITPGTYAFLGAAAALGGVMRMTVTVVVIMFELTGALTYILPTMIVLLVTKAVGDFFGKSGIADEMIRFNGYPFLDKEDHAFHIPVSRVMKKELATIPSSGFSVRDLEILLESTEVQGFPVVSGDEHRTLLGYMGRAEIKYILGKARRTRDLPPDLLCSFAVPQGEDRYSRPSTDTMVDPPFVIEDDPIEFSHASTSLDNTLSFRPWMNRTPLTVAPQQPLEIVMQLFKRMGPRVILVEDHGSLVGLVTVKDVLRFIATAERTHSRTSPWEEGGALNVLLEDALQWLSDIWQRCLTWIQDLVLRKARP